jgi:class 3 adenylate cyclase
MADDEVATVETLKRYRAEIGRIIERHKGRIVNAPGDNILAEFASAVEVVRGTVNSTTSAQNVEHCVSMLADGLADVA